MRFPFRISLYYKLFLVFGLTFLGVIQIMGDSLTRPFEEEDVNIILIQVVACVALIIINALLVRELIKPLAALTKFSRELSGGKFSSRIGKSTNDEIGELAKSMNSMAERIQQQMESLKHMAVGVSHEIRSPLARMRMAVEMLPNHESKNILSEQIHELDSITGVILEREALNSGLSELKLQPVELGALLDELAEYYIKSNRPVVVKKQAVTIKADRRRLEMCLKNLLDNSFQHGGGGRPVEIECAARDQGVEIKITDFGKGPMKAAKSSGFGLGILLSESIAKAHRGSLNIAHLPDQGTCATIIIPDCY